MLIEPKTALDLGIGFVIGCFCPAVARKVKSYLSKEAGKVEAKVASEASAVEKKL